MVIEYIFISNLIPRLRSCPEMPNIENHGQYQDQDQYQVDFFLPILGLVLGLAPKKVPNILEIVSEKGLGFVFF